MRATRIAAPPTVRVCAPDEGWLSIWSPTSTPARVELSMLWREATVAACRAAGLGPVERPVGCVFVARLASREAAVLSSVRVPHDVFPTVHRVLDGLVQARVLPKFRLGAPRMVLGEREVLELGEYTGSAAGQGYLELWFREVSDAGRG